MGELVMAIVSSILVNQSVAVGSKIINNKRVTRSEREGLGLALLTFALVNLATQPTTFKSLGRK
jgi:hypothetical protein